MANQYVFDEHKIKCQQSSIDQETDDYISQFSHAELNSFTAILNDQEHNGNSINIPMETHELDQLFNETFLQQKTSNNVQEILDEVLKKFGMNDIMVQCLDEFRSIHKCICGHYLIPVKNESHLYDGNGCCCNQCGKLFEVIDSMWYCEQKDDLHAAGFYICKNCIDTFNPQLFQQMSNLIISNRNTTIQSECTILLQFLNKILTHPNNSEYHRISCNVLLINVSNYDLCFQSLKNAGFKESTDGKWLVWEKNETNVDILRSLSLALIMILILLFESLQSKIDSGYLLNSVMDRNSSKQHDEKCYLSTCLCLKNIIQVMKRYKSYINRSTSEQKEPCIKGDIYKHLGNQYDDVNLLDDFNHLLLSHSHQFEYIHDILNYEIYSNNCKLSKCLLMRRHHTDRAKISENEKILNELYFLNDDVASQQLLDRIHCYYIHSFDTGCKLSNKDKQEII
eukprot:358270_1